MARKQSFKNVRTVLFEQDSDLRQNIKSTLTQDTFTQTTAMSALKSAQAAMHNDEADLILVDIDKENAEICDLMRRIRHNEVGKNPFPVAIAMSGDSDYTNVRKAINAGFDVLLLKPFSMSTLLDRIHHLMAERSPFAVTSDYIGPDRRQRATGRKRGRQTPMVAVPNPLKAMATGDISPARLRRRIEKTITEINDRRVECHAETITDVVGRLMPKFMHHELDAAFVEDLKKLREISRDMDRRLARSKFAPVADLCASMGSVVARILESPVTPRSKDMDLLQTLSIAIDRAFLGDEAEAALAYGISDAIRANA